MPPPTGIDCEIRHAAVHRRQHRHPPHIIRRVALGDTGNGGFDIQQRGIIGQLPGLPETHQGRLRALFSTGFELGQRVEIGTLQEVFFISEGWMSFAQGEQPPTVPPSLDPQRKEVLLIASLAIPERTGRLAVLEMVRDADGELTTINPLRSGNAENQIVDNPLLAAFAAGYDTGRRSRN